MNVIYRPQLKTDRFYDIKVRERINAGWLCWGNANRVFGSGNRHAYSRPTDRPTDGRMTYQAHDLPTASQAKCLRRVRKGTEGGFRQKRHRSGR